MEITEEEFEELKQEHIEYLEENGSAYPSDIAKDLGCRIECTLHIINVLKEEGIVEGVNSNER